MPKPYLWPDNLNNVVYNPWTDLRWRKDVAKLKLKFPWEKIPGILRDIFISYLNKYTHTHTHISLHFFVSHRSSLFSERFAKQIIQAYYAAVSYIDNMIGKLIHQLYISMIRENTIVILTSDHGIFNE